MNNLIIGIAGGSGSGKTTLALRLKERFGEDEVQMCIRDSSSGSTKGKMPSTMSTGAGSLCCTLSLRLWLE